LQEIFRIFSRVKLRVAITGFMPLLIISACSDPAPVAKAPARACGTDGGLRVEFYGGLETAIEWNSNQLECQGMPRPNGAGARLRFAGKVGNGKESVPLAIILGIPSLERGQSSKELPTNVTVIDEAHGRFFATQDVDSCWSDIDRHQPSDNSSTRPGEYVVDGILYCVSPLAELHGSGSLRLSDLHFTGLIDWKTPE